MPGSTPGMLLVLRGVRDSVSAAFPLPVHSAAHVASAAHFFINIFYRDNENGLVANIIIVDD